MKAHLLFNKPHGKKLGALLALVLGLAQTTGAAVFVWNVASPGNNDWNVNGNWNPGTSNPGATDTALFGATGTSTSSTTINNIVSVNTAISFLQYTNQANGAWHVTQIPTGITLTVTNGITVGGITNEGTAQAVAFTGGGTLLQTGGNFIEGNSGAATFQNNTNDMSALSTFVYAVTTGLFDVGASNRSGGTFNLAGVSNSITAATINFGTGSTSSSGTQVVKLGSGTNIINATAFNLAAGREAGNLQFFSSTGGLRLRGLNGGDTDRANLVVGLRSTGSSTPATTTGTVSWNGHQVDAMLSSLVLGTNNQTANTNIVGTGTLQFNQGIINASTVSLGGCGGNSTTLNLTNGANGTITVGTNTTANAAGTLIVGSGGLSLANVASTASGSYANGTLNIFGGNVICSNNIFKTTTVNSTGTVAVANGNLFVQGKLGSPAAPIDNFNVTNSVLMLNIDASAAITTNAVVKSLNVDGATTTTIVINQVNGVNNTVTIPLIAYTTLTGGTVVGNFAVVIPAGYHGNLVDNSAQGRIDLSITADNVIVPLVWTAAANSDWDTTSLDWIASGSTLNYTDGSTVVFDDTAASATVNLTAQLFPASMTMSNSSLTYIFTGTGSIGGTNSLALKTGGTTILDNSGSNSFTGGTFVGAGTLQIGNNDTSGNLPDAAPVAVTSALVFDRTDTTINNSVISGTGTVTQNGSGTLVLAGANSYGGTTISAGILQIGNDGTTGTLGTGAVTDNGSLAFDHSDNITVGNVISGSGSVTKNSPDAVTLTGNNTYAGGLTVNAGSVRLGSATAGGAAATSTITVNSGAAVVMVVTNVTSTNNVTLAGGTIGSQFGAGANIPFQLTAAPAITSYILTGDPANLLPTQADASEMNFTNTLHGSGSILVSTVSNDTNADSGSGFRLRSPSASDFSGTLIISNNVKGELQTTVAGPFSPAGSGNIVLVCGSVVGGNVTTVPVVGGAPEFNLRNNNTGDTVLGNNVSLQGSGIVILNPLGSAPTGSKVTMGSLTLGGGQELGVYLASGSNPHNVVFTSVTLTGGSAVFSPKIPGFGSAGSVGSDLTLGNISETASSSITMAGLNNLFLTGANTYSGNTIISSGTLWLTNSATIANSPNISIAGGAKFDVSGLTSTFGLGAGQTLTASGGGTATLGGPLNLNSGALVLDYTVGTPALQVTNGTLSFNNNAVTVNVSGTPSQHLNKLIAANAGGAVGGTLPASPTITGLSGGVNSLTVSNGELYLVVDQAPVAGPSFTNGVVVGVPFTVPIVGGKYGPTDADGDVLTITSVSGAANGTVSTDGTNVTYTATGGSSDSFSYTVSDGFGGTASQTVYVLISSNVTGNNQVGAQMVGGQAVLTYYGIPNRSYALDWTHSLTPPVTWTPLLTNAAGSNGQMQFTNTPSGGNDFYRTRSVGP